MDNQIIENPIGSIEVRDGRPSDFEDIDSFAAKAIRPAYDHPSLTAERREENERIISIAKEACLSSVGIEDRKIWVVTVSGQMAGFIIADKTTDECPEIDWLIVAPEFQGKGVAQKLMEAALSWIGDNSEIKLGVIHYNQRAIAFYKKYGFKDTGRIAGKHKIPRKLMKRPVLSQKMT